MKRGIQEKRATIVSMGVISVTALVALVYAFFQQTAAKKEQIMAEITRMRGEKEVAILKKQILIEQAKLLACEQAWQDFQSDSKKSKDK